MKEIELKLEDILATDNIAELLDKDQRSMLAIQCLEDMEADMNSHGRQEWLNSIDKINALADMKIESVDNPWPDSCSIKYPIIARAAITNSSKLQAELLDRRYPVRPIELGKITESKKASAQRIKQHMAYQLIGDRDSTWKQSTDQMMYQLFLHGTVVRKIYPDINTGKKCQTIVPISQFIIDNDIDHIKKAERVSEKVQYSENDIVTSIRSKIFIDYDYNQENDEYDGKKFYPFVEQHRVLDLDDDGYAEPYILVIDENSKEVVRIIKNFDLGPNDLNEKGEVVRLKKKEYYVAHRCYPSSDGSFLWKGVGHLLVQLNQTVNKIIKQEVDANTLRSRQGAFIAANARIIGGTQRIKMNENVYVKTATGAALRDSILPYPTTPPNPSVFQILQLLLEAGQSISDLGDVIGDELKTHIPAMTVMAGIEEKLKDFSAIHKRVYDSLTEEFCIQYRLNQEYPNKEEYMTVLDDPNADYELDYNDANLDIYPNADPILSSQLQRHIKKQMYLEFSQNPAFAPFINGYEVLRRVAEDAGEEEIDQIIVKPQPQQGPTFDEVALHTTTKLEYDKLQAKQQKEAKDLELKQRQMQQQELESMQKLELERQKVQAQAEADKTQAVVNLVKAKQEKDLALGDQKMKLTDILIKGAKDASTKGK